MPPKERCMPPSTRLQLDHPWKQINSFLGDRRILGPSCGLKGQSLNRNLGLWKCEKCCLIEKQSKFEEKWSAPCLGLWGGLEGVFGCNVSRRRLDGTIKSNGGRIGKNQSSYNLYRMEFCWWVKLCVDRNKTSKPVGSGVWQKNNLHQFENQYWGVDIYSSVIMKWVNSASVITHWKDGMLIPSKTFLFFYYYFLLK